ncbi:MAG: CNNM domain-containing protein, partial [Pirellulaceae bacterium]
MSLILAASDTAATPSLATNLTFLGIAIFLVLLNGFFVAAEFALVKVRKGQIDQMIKTKRPFAKTSMWLADRMDQSLSTCQLGITMASLALGWIGEPAFHYLLNPVFELLNMGESVTHILAFIAAFTVITALH